MTETTIVLLRLLGAALLILGMRLTYVRWCRDEADVLLWGVVWGGVVAGVFGGLLG